VKILIYCLNYYPEIVGAGKYTTEMSEWLSSNGYKVRVITSNPYYPEWKLKSKNKYKKEIINGVEIFRSPLWVPNNPSGIKRIFHLLTFSISSLPLILRHIFWRPSVIITIAPTIFCIPGSLFLGLICGSKTKNLLHIQDFEIDAAFQLGFLKGKKIKKIILFFEKRLLSKFNKITTISKAMLIHLKSKNIEDKKILFFPNWIDTEFIKSNSKYLNSYRRDLEINYDETVLHYSGTLSSKQGIEIIIDSIKILKDNKKIIWVIGGEGPLKNELIEKTKIYPNVHIMPLQPINRFSDWLTLADIHLLPQKKAAADLLLPSKLLGMMASGKPIVCISPKKSELGKIVSIAGIQVEDEKASEFSNAILNLINNKEMSIKKGKNGRKLVKEIYDKKKVLTNFESDLKDLVLEE
tara:strand:- start:85800 stop:87026 length:1227 start_codon:yes stop_codon:yes gene_type:complete